MAKKITETLPAGIAVFPKLNQVDVYQPLDKKGRPMGEPKRRFVARVKFSDEDHRKVAAWLDKCAEQLDAGPGRPWKTDKKTKEITLMATSGEKYPPLLVDAKNKKLPAGVVVGGGSKLRLNVTVNDYPLQGGGINLYMNAVQVLELQESSFGKSPFDEQEGYVAPESTEDKEFDPHASADADDELDDEIPF